MTTNSHLTEEGGRGSASVGKCDSLEEWLSTREGEEKAVELFVYLYDSTSETARRGMNRINGSKDFSPAFILGIPFFAFDDSVTSSGLASKGVKELLQFKKIYRQMLISAMNKPKGRIKERDDKQKEQLKKEIERLTRRYSTRVRNAIMVLFVRLKEDIDALYDYLTQENFSPLRVPRIGAASQDEFLQWCTQVKKIILDFRTTHHV